MKRDTAAEFVRAHRAWHASDGIDTTPLEKFCEAEERLIAEFFEAWGEDDFEVKTTAYAALRDALLYYNAGRYAH